MKKRVHKERGENREVLKRVVSVLGLFTGLVLNSVQMCAVIENLGNVLHITCLCY